MFNHCVVVCSCMLHVLCCMFNHVVVFIIVLCIVLVLLCIDHVLCMCIDHVCVDLCVCVYVYVCMDEWIEEWSREWMSLCVFVYKRINTGKGLFYGAAMYSTEIRNPLVYLWSSDIVLFVQLIVLWKWHSLFHRNSSPLSVRVAYNNTIGGTKEVG